MTPRFTPLTCLAALAVLAGCSVPVVTNGNVGGSYGTPGQPATQQPGGGAASPQPAGPAKAVKDVRVTPDSFVVTVNDAKDLLATVAYTDGTFDGNVAWSSSDSRIVDVNPTTGKLQAKAEGIATVVASSLSDPARRANVTVTVRKGTVQEAIAKIDPKEASLALGETVQLSAQIQLTDGSSSPNVTWSSSNQSVAMVSGAGLVTGVGKGKATITATASGDSTKKATCTITVTE